MNTYLKFSCIYCGQHIECSPCLSGRQTICPACLHRITIPTPRSGSPARQAVAIPHTWDSHVPFPQLEIPTRHRPERQPPARLAGIDVQTPDTLADKVGLISGFQHAGSESGAPSMIPALAHAA